MVKPQESVPGVATERLSSANTVPPHPRSTIASLPPVAAAAAALSSASNSSAVRLVRLLGIANNPLCSQMLPYKSHHLLIGGSFIATIGLQKIEEVFLILLYYKSGEV